MDPSRLFAALSQRPAATRVADRWAAPFLWAVLLLAAGAAFAWQAIDPSRAVWVAVSVLIVTCPCALSLAAPSALLSAAGALARRGVLLRNLDALETLAGVRHVVLDKTGTLTDTRPAWRGADALTPQAQFDKEALLRAAASLATWSTHPLARTLAEVVPETAADSARWSGVREEPGLGLEAFDAQGLRWRLGSARWLGIANVDTPSLQACFGPAGQPKLALNFDEALRADAAQAVQRLQADGVRITLLSGDSAERVRRLARRLGLAQAVGGASPERKLQRLRELQAQGQRVAMVGDGVNDAPVLAQADVSFAMGHGALVARTHADAVILSGCLGAVVDARRLAQRTLRVIHQNLAWAALYNLACVPLALAGALPPWAAGLGMALSSLLVVSNALRLSR